MTEPKPPEGIPKLRELQRKVREKVQEKKEIVKHGKSPGKEGEGK